MTLERFKKICAYLDKLTQGTPWQGHIFAVGGCCRDMTLGLPIHDVDLAVDLPDGGVQFAEWLHRNRKTTHRPVIFKRYGTASIRLRAFPDTDLEIVQTRSEKYTDKNSRNPSTAHGSILQDCLRRDLTINALYYDIHEDKMLDICGRSLDDLHSRRIDTPSDPDDTYDDDPIRILRTVRFAARLGWEVPARLLDSMSRHSSRLTIIKPERMSGEFEKILLLDKPSAALDALARVGALAHIVSPLQSLAVKNPELWVKTLRRVDFTPADTVLRWASLLADIEPSEIPPALMWLKYHAQRIKDVVFYAVHARSGHAWLKGNQGVRDADLRHLQYVSGSHEKMLRLLSVIHAENLAACEEGYSKTTDEYVRNRIEAMHASGRGMYGYHLPFAERRIKRILHIPPGPLVEDTLDFMMRSAFENPKLTRAQFEKLVAAYTPEVKNPALYVSNEPRPSARSAKKPGAKDNRSQNLADGKRKGPRGRKGRGHHRRRNRKPAAE